MRQDEDPDANRDEVQLEAEHARWVEDGMEGDCPRCGEASGFHDDDGSCPSDDE